MTAESTGKDPENLQDQAWDYFQLHSSQRIATFNFFVILSGLALNALVTTLKPDFEHHWAGAVLGLVLVIVSFTFWKLDERNRQLIKLAEEALVSFEDAVKLEGSNGELHPLKLFSREARSTRLNRGKRSRRPWKWLLTYAQCFRIIFWLFAISGLVGMAAAVWLSVDQERRSRDEWTASGLVPHTIVSSVREADRSYEARAYHAAVLVLRETLEGILRSQGLPPGGAGSLSDGLAVLAARGAITRSTAEAAAALPVLNGSSVPGTTEPVSLAGSAADVRVAREIVRQVAEALYVDPAQIRATRPGSGR